MINLKWVKTDLWEWTQYLFKHMNMKLKNKYLFPVLEQFLVNPTSLPLPPHNSKEPIIKLPLPSGYLYERTKMYFGWRKGWVRMLLDIIQLWRGYSGLLMHQLSWAQMLRHYTHPIKKIQAVTDRCTPNHAVLPSQEPKFVLSFRVWCALRLHQASPLFHLLCTHPSATPLPFIALSSPLLPCSPLWLRPNEVIVIVCLSHRLVQLRSHPVLISE